MKISSFALPVPTARGSSRISENVAGLSSEFLFSFLIGLRMPSLLQPTTDVERLFMNSM
jgi:hypothetical protein